MIAVYLDEVLNEEELEAVEDAVGEEVECRRVPWLWPTSADVRDVQEPLPTNAVLPHLRSLDLPHDGRRLLLVPPRDVRWSTALAEAIRQETGIYPLLVQTENQRTSLGRPGPLRLLDMEAYYLDEDASSAPPWMEKDDSNE